MWRSKSKPGLTILFLLLTSGLLTGCQMVNSIINLTPQQASLVPSQNGAILGASDPIGADFSEPVVPASAESALSLKKGGQSVSVDFVWVGNHVTIKPLQSLDPGSRYTLALSGSVSFQDSSVKNFTQSVSFYSLFQSDPPQVVASSPQAGYDQGPGSNFVISFSQAIDPNTLTKGLSFTPDTARSVSWSADQKTLTITPQTTWQTLTSYKLSFSTDLKSAQGQALAAAWTGNFLVQNTDPAPTITNQSFIPYASYLSSWSPTASVSANPNWKDVLVEHFSQGVDSDDFISHATLSPSVTGQWVKTAPATLVYLPQDGWDMNTAYTLTIGSLKGLGGRTCPLVPLLQTWSTAATIPTQTASLKINPGSGDVVIPAGDLSATPTALSYAVSSLVVTLEFTQDINAALVSKLASADLIQPLLPSSAASPSALCGISLSSRKLILTYDLAPPSKDTQALYKLALPYGKDSTANDGGSYLAKETDFLFLLENN